MNAAPPIKTSSGKSAFMSIPNTLLVAANSGVSICLLGNTLLTKDAVNGRFKLLALLLILGMAVAGMFPDFDLPAASRLADRVRTLKLITHLHDPSPLHHAATIAGPQPAIANSGSGNCIIDLTCSRLC